MVTNGKKISRNFARSSSAKDSLVRLEGTRSAKGKRAADRGTTGSQKGSRKKKDRSSIFQGPKVEGFFSRISQDIVIQNVNVPLVPMEKLKNDYETAPIGHLHSKRSAAAALEEQLTLADYHSSDNETMVQSSGVKVAADQVPTN